LFTSTLLENARFEFLLSKLAGLGIVEESEKNY